MILNNCLALINWKRHCVDINFQKFNFFCFNLTYVTVCEKIGKTACFCVVSHLFLGIFLGSRTINVDSVGVTAAVSGGSGVFLGRGSVCSGSGGFLSWWFRFRFHVGQRRWRLSSSRLFKGISSKSLRQTPRCLKITVLYSSFWKNQTIIRNFVLLKFFFLLRHY